MLFLLAVVACLTPNWLISLQIHDGLTILGTLRLRGLQEHLLFKLAIAEGKPMEEPSGSPTVT